MFFKPVVKQCSHAHMYHTLKALLVASIVRPVHTGQVRCACVNVYPTATFNKQHAETSADVLFCYVR